MIPDLASITAILILGIPGLIFLMFLPTILKLKKLVKAKPNNLTDNVSELQIQMMHNAPIVNIESEQKFESQVTQSLDKVIAVLPDLEV